jgi:hypothetical protein
MTYINAFKCQNGIVLSADTQEAWGDYKNYVEKIATVEGQSYPLAIGGAGIGDLIDPMLQEVVEKAAAQKPATADDLRAMLRESIEIVYNLDLPWLAVKKPDRSPMFLIAAKPPNDDFCIFRIQGRRLKPDNKVRDSVGYATPAVDTLFKRMHRENLPMQQAVMLAIYLVSQAKIYADGVGGETSVVLVTNNGAWREVQEYVKSGEERVANFLKFTDSLFLSAIDSSIPPSQFPEVLEQFKENVAQLREKYLRETAELVLRLTLTDQEFRGFPYPKLFLGARIGVGFGPLTVTEETAEDRKWRQELFQIAQRGYNQLEMAKFSKLIDGRPPLYTGIEKVHVRGTAGPRPASDNS